MPGNPISRLFTRAMLMGATFSGPYTRLRALYSVEDPWGMSSEREQHRFEETNRQLGELGVRFGHVLELGCGEGHQSVHLARIAGRLSGLEVSPKAVARARERVPAATFEAGRIEDVPALFADQRFDLITACEVLYYTPDVVGVLALLQARTGRLYVSNYSPRDARMPGRFVGPGWRRLDTIRYGEASWECHLWEADQAGVSLFAV